MISDELREVFDLLLDQEDFRYVAIVKTGQSISTVRNMVAQRGAVTKNSTPVLKELIALARKKAVELDGKMDSIFETLAKEAAKTQNND